MLPGGLLPPERPETKASVNDESWRKMFVWLGEQKPKSVVFVGSGSDTMISVYGSKNQNCVYGIARLCNLEIVLHCLFPFIIDQPLNTWLLVEKALAVQVDRNGDGSFSRDASQGYGSSYGV
ncbi:hypothetical protein SADUNF_Sadunf04G0015900 [Salix dunnii]|uniref:Uncharacterized protein n=1 Tax=Salix dunnii TaxID=1413687 RepID=A0A835K5G1_9ROSI|nr:hypothetical protein SADUNF_Sadunf04G0015900 [Salix dunnii]